MGKYKGAFGNGGGFVDNKDYSKEIASEFEGMTEEEIVVEAKNAFIPRAASLFPPCSATKRV